MTKGLQSHNSGDGGCMHSKGCLIPTLSVNRVVRSLFLKTMGNFWGKAILEEGALEIYFISFHERTSKNIICITILFKTGHYIRGQKETGSRCRPSAVMCHRGRFLSTPLFQQEEKTGGDSCLA